MRHCKDPVIPTLSPKEAVRLGVKRPVDDLNTVKSIYDEHKTLFGDCVKEDCIFTFFVALSTCYNAGRVEGIRQERAKRRKRI